MQRRKFLQAAAVLVAGATTLPRGWTLDDEQHAFLAAQANYIDRHSIAYFTPVQRATVAAMAEQVIPATGSPGAIEAGVPRFIELMVADWLDQGERSLFMDGLMDVLRRCGGDFAALPQEQQLATLEQLEDEASNAGWYQPGNIMRVWDDTAPFICQFKELCVLGFFLSEAGATSALRENPMGRFEGDIPLHSGDSAYATQMPFHILFGVKTNNA